MEDNKNFEIEVSDFKYVSKGIKNGKALRFSVTWKFTHPRYGLLGMTEEGWLATKHVRGSMHVSPPIHRWGPTSSKQLKAITSDLHDLVLSMLVNHKTKGGKSYMDYVGHAVSEEFMAKVPTEVDEEFGELPEEIAA